MIKITKKLLEEKGFGYEKYSEHGQCEGIDENEGIQQFEISYKKL